MDKQQIFKLFMSTNLLRMDIESPIYKYDVYIQPQKFQNNSDREAVFLGVRKIMHISHDVERIIFLEKNIGLLQRDNIEQEAQWIAFTNKQMHQGNDSMNILGYQIEIKQVYENGTPAFVSTNQDRLVFLKALAREMFDKLQYHQYQGGYFNPIDPPNAALSKDKSVVYQTYSWNGVRPETIELRGKVYLQLETTPVRMLRMNVYEVINRLKAKQFSVEEISNFFVGRTIKTSYFSSNLYYEIVEINYDLTPDAPMVGDNNNIEGDQIQEEQISYYEYAKRNYRINIRDRVQPMLKVRPLYQGYKSQLNNQSYFSKQSQEELNETYLIPSLCNLFDDIAQKGFIDDNLGPDFYHEPLEVYEYLNQINQFLKNSQEVQDLLKAWQVSIGEECEQIGYNYLKLSSILLLGQSGKNEPFSPNDLVCKRLCHEFDGYYKQLFCSNNAFAKFAAVENWAVFVHSDDVQLAEGLVSSISQFKLYFNYPIEQPKYYKLEDSNQETWAEQIKTVINPQGDQTAPTFILVIANSQLDNYWFYKQCKQLITVEKGISCKIMKSSTLAAYIPTQLNQKMSPNNSIEAFSCRFLAQMQAQLGESPWLVQSLPFNQNPSTMIGFSVLRQKNQRKIVVSAAASINKYFSKYQTDYRVISEVQTQTLEDGTTKLIELTQSEILNSITNATKEILQTFLNSFAQLHKTNPTWVIVVRDGELLENAENEKNALFSLLSSRRASSENKGFQLLYSTSVKQIGFRAYNFSGSSEMNANNQNVYSPSVGTIIEKNFNKREFYLYTQRIVKNSPFCVLYSVLHIDKFIGLDEQSLLADFQDLIYNTYILNYDYHTKTTYPAPLQNAQKLARFISMYVTPAGSSQNTIDLSNLRVLSANYKLFFL